MTDRLFVYGTLAPGKPNAHVLAGVAGSWEPASVRGRLYEEGWGAALGYPGVVLGADGVVPGLLFSSAELADHWQRLDDFEGEGYDRVVTPVLTASGSVLDACVYALREIPS